MELPAIVACTEILRSFFDNSISKLLECSEFHLAQSEINYPLEVGAIVLEDYVFASCAADILLPTEDVSGMNVTSFLKGRRGHSNSATMSPRSLSKQR